MHPIFSFDFTIYDDAECIYESADILYDISYENEYFVIVPYNVNLLFSKDFEHYFDECCMYYTLPDQSRYIPQHINIDIYNQIQRFNKKSAIVFEHAYSNLTLWQHLQQLANESLIYCPSCKYNHVSNLTGYLIDKNLFLVCELVKEDHECVHDDKCLC